jgi:GAF domain-containing protein
MVMAADPLRAATDALSRFLVAKATLGETLQQVAELALAAVSAADGVGLTLLEKRKRPVTVFASDASLSTEIDQAQYDDDEGPCLESYRRRVVIKVDDTKAARHWPGYARAAVESQVGSTLSPPLTAADQTYGALNFYARSRFAFDEADVEAASVIATQASIVLANASAYWDARDLATGLGEAMKSRAIIEQAKGKLMATGRYNADQAFEVLARTSQRGNVRLRDMAHRIVHGTDPTDAPVGQL